MMYQGGLMLYVDLTSMNEDQANQDQFSLEGSLPPSMDMIMQSGWHGCSLQYPYMESSRYQPRSRFYSAGSAASFTSHQLAPIHRPHSRSEPNILQYQPLGYQMQGDVRVNPPIGQTTVFTSDPRRGVKARGGAGLDDFHRQGSHTVVVNPPQKTKQFLSESAETNRQVKSSKRTHSVRPKVYVLKACVNCKASHVACDAARPCKRCVRLGKIDTCVDASRKKRGRPCNSDRRMSHMNNVTMYATTAPSTSVPPTLQYNILSPNPIYHPSQFLDSQKQLRAPFSSGIFHFLVSEPYIPISLSYPQTSDTSSISTPSNISF